MSEPHATRWQAEQAPYPLDADYYGESAHIFELESAAEQIVGKLDAGGVFTYLFRRFGYPRFGWDGMKHLVMYRITTPMAGVILMVEPGVTGAFTFGYILREDVATAYEAEERTPYENWMERFEAWALEEHGIEIIKMFEQDNDKLNRMWKVWGEDKEDRDFPSEKDAHNAFFTDQEAIRVKYVEIYKEIAAFPKITSLKDRPTDSTVKQCHTALCAAIRDMLRPVYVRDVMIDIRGEVRWDETLNQDEAVVMYAAGSGCGVGDRLDKDEVEQGAGA